MVDPPPNTLAKFMHLSQVRKFLNLKYCYKVLNVCSSCGDKDDMDCLCFIFSHFTYCQ